MIKKKSICIISFSPIYRDARVLRQIRYLSKNYNLTVIGFGPPSPEFMNKEHIKWISIGPVISTNINKERKAGESPQSESERGSQRRLLHSFFRASKLFLSCFVALIGRLHPFFYEVWYWRSGHYIQALQCALEVNCHAFHANDLIALPVAAEAAKKKGAKLIFDAHEYAPLELENRRYWRLFFRPIMIYFLKKYSASIDASITVAPLISRRYKKEFGLDPIVVLNVPERIDLPEKKFESKDIRLVHHGGAIRDRGLERMIEALSFCGERFTLHFLLIDTDRSYMEYLKKTANKLAPSRVTFHDPVTPEKIVQRISEYDMGFYLLEPNSYNNKVALPNKFFDFIVAGLAVCIGPSPSMVEMVREYGFGCVASSFDPHDVAHLLNGLTSDHLKNMYLASREASWKINAEREMTKLLELYDRLLNHRNIHETTKKLLSARQEV